MAQVITLETQAYKPLRGNTSTPSYTYLVEKPESGYISKKIPRGILHKCEIILEGPKSLADFLAKSMFKQYTEKTSRGPKYTCYVYREDKGETITVYEYSDKTVIRLTTHKLQRLRTYWELSKNYVVRDISIELYARIHKISEKRAEIALESLRKSQGLGKIHIVKSTNYVDQNYLLRIEKFTYNSVYVSVKLYYDKQLKEYPKIEVMVLAKTLETLDKLIGTAGIILNTIVKASKSIIVYNEYDLNQDMIEIRNIDKQLLKQIRGTRSRIKGELILENQLRDKHKIVKEFLVKGYRPVEIARILGYSRQYVNKIIRELLDAGQITRISRGKYAVNPKKPRDKTLASIREIVNLEVENVKIIRIGLNADYRETLDKIMRENTGFRLHPDQKPECFPIIFYRESNGEYEYLKVSKTIYPPAITP